MGSPAKRNFQPGKPAGFLSRGDKPPSFEIVHACYAIAWAISPKGCPEDIVSELRFIPVLRVKNKRTAASLNR